MTPRIYILTGASRGLGRAMAQQLLQPGHHLLTLARKPDPALAELARKQGAQLTDWSIDLADAPVAAERLKQWLAAQAPADTALINNAAPLATPGPLEEASAAELSSAIRVGLEAPLLLSAAFLQATAGWASDRRILNISSGLGRHAMAGSASYCAAKAGMDHFSRAVALEQADRKHPVRIVSLAPGVIDTDMQIQLRNSDPARFPEQARFKAMKDAGQLDSPDAAATKVLRYLARADFGSNPIGDVRDA